MLRILFRFSQIKLKPLEPQTEEENTEFSIAAERRRMRLAHTDTIKELVSKSPVQAGRVSSSVLSRASAVWHGLPWFHFISLHFTLSLSF